MISIESINSRYDSRSVFIATIELFRVRLKIRTRRDCTRFCREAMQKYRPPTLKIFFEMNFEIDEAVRRP